MKLTMDDNYYWAVKHLNRFVENQQQQQQV